MAFTANDIKYLVRRGWNGDETHIEYEQNFVSEKSRGYIAGFGIQFKPGSSIRWILRYLVKERTGDSLHHFKAVREVAVGFAAALSVALSLLLIPRFGILGAGIASGVSLLLLKASLVVVL